MSRLLPVALITACMALIVWIRMIPATLPAAAPSAEGARYVAADGQTRVYLGGIDGFLWLRNARNYLRSGSTCDRITPEGECRDALTLAPVGTRMLYNRSAHISAIVVLHRLLSAFESRFPLQATAFLLQVLLGALAVIPAFLIGRRLSSDLGGVFVAILSGLNTSLLLRSLGSDNDVWNVALPLFMTWGAIEAMAAKTSKRRVGFSAVAGFFAATQVVTWRGWLFAYVIVLVGLTAHATVAVLRHLRTKRRSKILKASAVRAAAIPLGVFYLATGVCASLMGAGATYFGAPVEILREVSGRLGLDAGPTSPPVLWPKVLSTVHELHVPAFGQVVDSVGGAVFFCAAIAGALLLVFPSAGWKRHHEAGAAAASAGRPVGAFCLLVAWAAAALHLSFGGDRFLLLLGPPFAIFAGVGAGRLWEWGVASIAARAPERAQIAGLALFAGLLLTLVPAVYNGHAVVRGYVPQMNSAWGSVLEKVRTETPKDALITTWWDYGYWVKYFAERRVSSDGGALITRVPHWVAKATAARTDKEAAGIIRMLNCGSDATPRPEGRLGAFGKLRAIGLKEIPAYTVLTRVVGENRRDAERYLATQGLSPVQRKDILKVTHCSPPESYFIVSSQQITTAGAWSRLGSWDPRMALVFDVVQRSSHRAAVRRISDAIGVPASAAEVLYQQASSRTDKAQRDAFIAPRYTFYLRQWYRCRSSGQGDALHCPVEFQYEDEGAVIESFEFDPASPGSSRIRLRTAKGAAARALNEAPPGVLLVADGTALRKVDVGRGDPTFGVLVDLPERRIFIAPPRLIETTFTRLSLLDGRYSKSFSKFTEAVTPGGERVTVWKVDWDDR